MPGALPPRPVRPAEWIAVTVLSVVGGGVVWWATGLRGPGLTSDSVAYLSTAQNIVDGRGFGSWQQMPLVHWPLGYPVLLAVTAKVTGASVITAGRVVGVGLAIGTGWATWRLAVKTMSSAALRITVTVVTMFGIATTSVEDKLLTDAALTLLAVLSVLALLHVVDAAGPASASGASSGTGTGTRARARARSRAWFVWAVALVWAMFLARYQGVAGAFAGAGVLALHPAARPVGRRLGAAAVFGAAALVLPVAYLSRTASAFRAEQAEDASAHSAVSDLRGLPQVVAEWAVGRPVPSALAVIGVALLVVLVAAAVLLGLRRRRTDQVGPEPVTDAAAGVPAPDPLGVLGLYWLVSLVFLLALRLVVYFDIDGRTLNLLFPLLLVFGIGLLDRIPSTSVRTAATVAAVAWCVLVAGFGVRALSDVRRDGSGFAASSFDATYDELRAANVRSMLPAGCRIQTNAPNVLYLAGIEAGTIDPGPTAPGDGPPCVVWIDAPAEVDQSSVAIDDVVRSHGLAETHRGRTFTVYTPGS